MSVCPDNQQVRLGPLAASKDHTHLAPYPQVGRHRAPQPVHEQVHRQRVEPRLRAYENEATVDHLSARGEVRNPVEVIRGEAAMGGTAQSGSDAAFISPPGRARRPV
jgi:hypothetical protein